MATPDNWMVAVGPTKGMRRCHRANQRRPGADRDATLVRFSLKSSSCEAPAFDVSARIFMATPATVL